MGRDYRLDRKRFEKWLRSKNPRARVGEPQAACDCPLARFLKSDGYEVIGVDGDLICTRPVGASADDFAEGCPPKWATTFIERVDDLPTAYCTARQALDILAGIPVSTGAR